MRGLSLFTGIGGLDLAAMACGITPAAMCEIEPFPVQILQKRFPGVPILPDVRKVNGHEYRGSVDIIFGGFPCQDLSIAGKRAGLVCGGGYTRSGLWYEMLRIISECRPRYVVGENVRGAVALALDEVQRGLEVENYQVRAVLVPASAVGAPHQRERVFIIGVRGDIVDLEGQPRERSEANWLADACVTGLEGDKRGGVDFKKERPCVSGAAPECGDDERSGVWRTPDANMTRGAISEEKYLEREQRGMPNALNYQVAHVERNWPTVTAGHDERRGSTQYKQGSMHSANLGDIVTEAEGRRGQLNPAWVEQLMGYPDGWTDPDCDEPSPWMGWPARPGEPQYSYEHPRTVVGMPNRAKRLKALGNAVVPQQAEPVFRALALINHLAFER